MIKINLIPKSLRKEKKSSLWGGLKIPVEIVLGSVGALVVLLLSLHMVFVLINTARLISYKNLQRHWQKIQPAKKEVDVLLEEKKDLDAQIKKIKDLVGVRPFFWSQILNLISEHLPKGVWLTELSFTEKALLIKGSAVSRQNTKMTNIHIFLSNLKDDNFFKKNFDRLELSSIQRRTIHNAEVADFLITIQFYKK